MGARASHLPKIAQKAPGSAKVTSREKQIKRFLANPKIEPADYFAPFARLLLQSFSHSRLVLAIDGSVVGRGCVGLFVNVIHQGRALPLAWKVVVGKKGALSTQDHLSLLKQVRALIPAHQEVVLLGDGEFDSPRLLAQVVEFGWHFVCRSAINKHLWLGDECTNFGGLAVRPGQLVAIPNVAYTRAEFELSWAMAYWRKGCSEPYYLVTDLALAEEALWLYKKRFRIETFFSDHKSRGFGLERSHLSEPARLERLILAAGLAYLWLVYLGTISYLEGWTSLIHRSDRCDWSLFSLGLALLEHFLNQVLPLPVAFIPLELFTF